MLLLGLIILSAGCNTLKPKWKWPGDDPEPEIPESVLPIWTDTILHQPGKPGIRGFGGRVYFYAKQGGDPIEVDGSLTVYVFDGDRYDAASNEPLRKFVITADQLASHHSATDLGDSYSVWVPWDKVGGPSRSLSLIASLTGATAEPPSRIHPASCCQVRPMRTQSLRMKKNRKCNRSLSRMISNMPATDRGKGICDRTR